MTEKQALRQLEELYDSTIESTLAEIGKTVPLTKKKLIEQLMQANKLYWTARLAQLDEMYTAEAEQCAAVLSTAYTSAAETFSDRVRSIYANYNKTFGLSQKDADELMKSVRYDRTIAENLRAFADELPDGEEKDRILAEMSAPAYRYRMQRAEQLTAQAKETCNRIAENEIATDRVFLQTQTEKALNITAEGLSEETPADKVIENIQLRFNEMPKGDTPVQEFTPTTDQGVLDSFSLTSTENVREIVNSDWSGKSFSERIWDNTDDVAKSIKGVLIKGELTGASEADMAQDVVDRFHVGMHEARRLVRTESNYCTNQAELRGYAAAGIEKYEYAALEDNRTSDICKALDGKVFKVADAVVGVNYPPMHPFCRSSTVAVIQTAEDIQREIDERIDSWNIPEGMSLDEFIDRVNNGELEQIREEQAENTTEATQPESYSTLNSVQESVQENSSNELTTDENGDIIKAITIEDISSADKDGDVSPDCQQAIINTLDKMKNEGHSFSYDSVSIINIPTRNGKTDPLRTNCVYQPGYPKVVLEINKAAFAGRSKEDMDLVFFEAKNTTCNSLEDAVRHEVRHAETIHGRTYAQYERISDELQYDVFRTPIVGRDDGKSIYDLAGDVSILAQKDGLECIAECGVKIDRGEFIDEDLRKFHDYYTSGGG